MTVNCLRIVDHHPWIGSVSNNRSLSPPGRRENLYYAHSKHAVNLVLHGGDVLRLVMTRICRNQIGTRNLFERQAAGHYCTKQLQSRIHNQMTVVRRQRSIYIPTPSVLLRSICDKSLFWQCSFSVGAVVDRTTVSADGACSKPVGQQRSWVAHVVAELSGRMAWLRLQLKIRHFWKIWKSHWIVR